MAGFSPHAPQDRMAGRVDVSRLSVAECMALGGGAGEAAEEEGAQAKLEKLMREIEEIDRTSTRGWRGCHNENSGSGSKSETGDEADDLEVCVAKVGRGVCRDRRAAAGLAASCRRPAAAAGGWHWRRHASLNKAALAVRY